MGTKKATVAESPNKTKAPAPVPAKKYTMSHLDEISSSLLSPTESVRKTAAKSIYELSDVSHKKNRVSIVRHSWSLVSNIVKCLEISTGDARHLALLALNNLSIPSDNKKTFVQDGHREEILTCLVEVIAKDSAEAYLACICAMNMSFLESSVDSIASFPNLLPTLETLLKDGVKAKQGSGKSESVRWACGLLKNLSRSKEASVLISQTSILESILQTLKNPSSASRWSNNSTEDFVLFTVLHLSQFEDDIVNVSGDVFKKLKAPAILVPIAKSATGSHSLKASLALSILRSTSGSDLPPSAGPDIVNLVNNVLSKRGQEGSYSAGVFKLSTAVKALKGYALKAKVDGISTPQGGALMLQIIASYTLASREAKLENLQPPGDAVVVFNKMLPILANTKVPKSGPTSETPDYTKAVAEISSLLSAYAALDGSKETLVLQTVETLKGYTGQRPAILEAQVEWKKQRERDGISSSFFSGDAGQEVTEEGPMSFLPCNSNTECVIL